MTDRKAPPPNAHAIVEIGDRRFDNWEHKMLFESLSVELTVGQMSKAEWRVKDETFRFMDSFTRSDGVPTLPCRVYMGYGVDLGEPIFKGLLAQVQHGTRTGVFTFFDKSWIMRREKRPGYNKGDDITVMRKLVERNGLKFVGPGRGFPSEKISSSMQDDQTDWEHFTELTNNAGLVTYCIDDTVFAVEPAKVGKPVRTFRYGVDFDFLRELDLVHRTPESEEGRPRLVEVRTRGAGGRRVTGRTADSGRGRVSVESTRSLKDRTPAGAKRRAEAKERMEREKAFENNIKTPLPLLNERIQLRNTVALENCGRLWSAAYVVDVIAYLLERASTVNYRISRDIKEV